MLTIEETQWQVLEEAARTSARKTMLDYANKRFPSEFAAKPQEELLAWINRLFELADEHAFDQNEHVALLLDLVVMYGWDFPRKSWAAPIFTDKAMPSTIKVELLRRQVADTGEKV